jgi:hypothetical protein
MFMCGVDRVRRAAKVDRNQAEIVRDLRKAGCSVWITSGVGQGAVDIVVGYDGRNFLLEIKDPLQPPSKRRLTEDESTFHAGWNGQIEVVETTEEAFRAVGVTQKC